jgi:hypothetical protein
MKNETITQPTPKENNQSHNQKEEETLGGKRSQNETLRQAASYLSRSIIELCNSCNLKHRVHHMVRDRLEEARVRL